MNKVMIFFILSCLAVYVQAEGDIIRQRKKEILTQCYAQVGLDYAKLSEEAKTMSADEFSVKVGTYKISCIHICFFQAQINKVPVRQYMLDRLDKAQENNPDVKQVERIDRTRKCIGQVEDECLLMQCFTLGDPQGADIID